MTIKHERNCEEKVEKEKKQILQVIPFSINAWIIMYKTIVVVD